jgi:hypothetical protein
MTFDMNLREKNSHIRLLTRAALLRFRASKLCQKNRNPQRGFAEKWRRPRRREMFLYVKLLDPV